ncbi:MAG: hypothetical protein HQK86_00095 [Nitrospinae bacterium]|nr:hypothetical protein [Nitrospinota bacterium]MBF0633754.1 hypothetical protein [Nitrospinota bacterium]
MTDEKNKPTPPTSTASTKDAGKGTPPSPPPNKMATYVEKPNSDNITIIKDVSGDKAK